VSGGGLDWLLSSLTNNVPGIRGVVILSPDGLPLGRSPGLTDDVAAHLSALAAGTHSLAWSVGQKFGYGDVSQTAIQMDLALFFITPVARGTCIALAADPEADAGQIAYELAVLVKRVGQHMAADPRFPGQNAVSP
jgi:predicted regulator of Ras-like GTPase activity (Roadblock/LC7/MglB family)